MSTPAPSNWLCALALWGALALGSAAPANAAAPKVVDDSRLARPVSIDHSGIYVGELLAELSRQTGVRLSAGSDRDGGNNYVIAAFLHAVTLEAVMDALPSLLGYTGGEWLWEEHRRLDGEREYRLLRSLGAQRMAAQLRGRLQRDLVANADALVQAARAGPAELQQLAAADPTLAPLLDSPRLRAGLHLIEEALSPQQRADILHGEKSIRVPVDQLSPAGQAFAQSVWAQGRPRRRDASGAYVPLPPPTWVQFTGHTPGGTELSPCIFIEMENLGGYAYTGGVPFQRRYRETLGKGWLLPGDEAVAPQQEGHRVPPAGADDVEKNEDAIGLRLRQLSRAASVPVMARLSPKLVHDPGSPRGLALGAFFNKLRGAPWFLERKWRAGIVLLAQSRSFLDLDQPSVPPWSTVKSLRSAADPKTGHIELANLVSLARELNDDQLRTLAAEFSIADAVARWRPLFLLYGSSPSVAARLTSAGGLPLPAAAEALSALPDQTMRAALDRPEAIAVRMSEETRKLPDGAARVELIVRVLDGAGRALVTSSMVFEPPPSRDPGATAPQE